ncbi:TetR/AcrR family transcriptional regulator [Pseudomonas gingeri]|uniref:TetR/AcrR family transcriptional regulator n=1 Tax=Pseudomonas gingeri TaxID=117681 RepID=UPI0015A297F8|nr:TetR/AcrR family transcriptional regulator [Pseudomonas gingeri]NWD06403.1 TetR/AcrR family transcriptional regulator [Pseudomonas gingeri]NWD49269.1 TetR/AcrR family transcriptional regulator [Pseudomonas gingeri]NWE33015.1 TetR/AcrR family transcriptional regulator [Pseudomonas gingeri]NWE55647.1 TetR/AcrR family transcriptional regulator [Pseudomonas gingeri]NWF03864.1 TetR/AcrR family transcriptional regulator [Pseudomonas gingeri]
MKSGLTDRPAAKEPATPAAGRPRSSDATEAVRKAALALAHEGGIAQATVERIAQRSGVAKTTIYRRWPSAGAILMDAFLAEISPFIEYVEEPTISATFRRAVAELIRALEGSRGRLLRHLLAAAQLDEQLQRAFWENWIEPRRVQGRALLIRARERGELEPGINMEVLMDLLFGAVYYRLMIPYAPLDETFAEQLIEQVFANTARRSAPVNADITTR